MKFSIPAVKLTVAISLAFLGCTRVQAQPKNSTLPAQPLSQSSRPLNKSLVFVAPPPPPNLGEPGRRSEAGSRGCEEEDQPLPKPNQREDKQLTALVPVYAPPNTQAVWALTTAPHPTFWFYVPVYLPTSSGEFVLQDEGAQTVYQTSIKPPQTPGVISLSIPSTAAPLESGKRYHWYLNIYCRAEQPPDFVEGWIQKVELSPTLRRQLKQATLQEQVALYATNGIWHEAIAAAAKLRRTNPKSTDWATLLQTVGLDKLSQKPL